MAASKCCWLCKCERYGNTRDHRLKPSLLFIALIFPVLSSWAGQQPLVTFSDPPGDDYGAGTLAYPQRADFQAGDLDLLHLEISRDEAGFWFEAMFKNPIRNPSGAANVAGIESLANFARKGFSQFNIDIYIDTDRIKGSGNTFTLPGRNVRIDSTYAWERAVILTPRPELMRQQLLDALVEQFPGRSNIEIEAIVDQSIFFPTQIRVRGKSITYFVHAGFFSGSDGTDWAITALVTGAMTIIPADLSLLPSNKSPLERLQLGVMQPVAGRSKDTFGYSGAIQSPVVDMLSPSAEQQVQQLTAMVDLTGVSWGPHAISGALTTDNSNDTPNTEQKFAGSINAKPVVLIDDLFQPESPTAVKSREISPAEAMPIADPSIARRLLTLQQLFDQKLIDETEYKQQRQRILNDL